MVATLRFRFWHWLSIKTWPVEGERLFRFYDQLMPVSLFAYRRWERAVPDYIAWKRKP